MKWKSRVLASGIILRRSRLPLWKAVCHVLLCLLQRHTAKRVFNRLTKEADGFDCFYRLVTEYVSARKKELNLSRQEEYIPLSHCAGEAKGDSGTDTFFENEKETTGKYLVLSFPYSNAGYPEYSDLKKPPFRHSGNL